MVYLNIGVVFIGCCVGIVNAVIVGIVIGFFIGIVVVVAVGLFLEGGGGGVVATSV